MIEFFNIMVIIDESQYDKILDFIEKNTSIFYIEEIGMYELNVGGDLFVSQFSILTSCKSKNEALKIIVDSIDFLCLRTEGSPYIYFPRYGDIIDIWYDIYEEKDNNSLYKDLLSVEERYKIIKKICSDKIEDTYNLMYGDCLTDEMILIELKEDTPELFEDEELYTIVGENSGEVFEIDIRDNIPDNYFKIISLKNLEKS